MKRPTYITEDFRDFKRYLHLDSEYRNRYQLFHLTDGTIEDTRKKNWRQVHWEKVVKIETHIRDKCYPLAIPNASFKFFVIYRNIIENMSMNRPKLHYWTQGWSNGSECFLMDIDFKTGLQRGEPYKRKVHDIFTHIHPRILLRSGEAIFS